MGEGRGQGPVGEEGGWAALAGPKASPLSGPSLSWGVSEEGPHGHGLAIVWLAGDETSPNQNQKGTEGGWGTRQKHKNPTVLPAAQAPVAKHEDGLSPARAFLTPSSPRGTEVDSASVVGFFFYYFVQK